MPAFVMGDQPTNQHDQGIVAAVSTVPGLDKLVCVCNGNHRLTCINLCAGMKCIGTVRADPKTGAVAITCKATLASQIKQALAEVPDCEVSIAAPRRTKRR